MAMPKSIRLTKEAEGSLAWLRKQVGGFNLNQAVSQMIVAAAKERGWKEGCE